MHYPRKQKLINGKLQLKLTLWVVGVATLSMLFQFVILYMAVSKIGTELPHDSQIFFQSLPETLFRSFLASLSICLSITFVAGILLTHRIAGPIYRFTQFLKGVNLGQHPDICRIRANDELKDFCALLNETTAPLRDMHHQDTEDADETIIRAA